MSEVLRILIVDDDHRMAKSLVDILKVNDHLAEASHSASEALEMITKYHYDCVLTDIKMPEMNGVELCRNIKTKRPKLPVILMTACSLDKLLEEGSDEGNIAILNKPLEINLLLSFFSSIRKERSIAIVNSDPPFFTTFGDILRLDDFSIAQINDPLNVCEKIRGNWQVMLLNMRLNDKSGLDILKDIRNRYPQLPMIFVTSYRMEMSSVIDTALNINAHVCFYKHLQIEKFLKILTENYHRELSRLLCWSVMK